MCLKDFDSRCQGVVPGFPEWGFELDGNASFVANRVTGEHLHVDVCNGPDVMATWSFEEYLQKHRRPDWRAHGVGPHHEENVKMLFSWAPTRAILCVWSLVVTGRACRMVFRQDRRRTDLGPAGRGAWKR